MRLPFIFSRRHLLLAGVAMSTCLSATAAPKISLTSPYFIPDQGWFVQGNTSFSVSASDANGISKVEFYVDDQLVSTDTTYPYSWMWNTAKNKIVNNKIANNKTENHTLKAVAFNTHGQAAGLQQAVTVETASVNNIPTQAGLSTTLANAARQLLLRDISVTRGGDNAWYLTGISTHRTANNHNEGINLWRSTDSQTWTYLGLVWSFEGDGNSVEKTWNQQQGKPARGVQSPEISFSNGSYYVHWNFIDNNQQKTKHIKSSGTAQGPYVAEKNTDASAQKATAENTAMAFAAAAALLQCNWWGDVFPVCVTTQNGWGWENEQSCVANSDCRALPSPYGIVNSVERCNWYGNYFPLCVSTQNGWGWENEQSCVARSDCSAQPSPWGIEGSTTTSSTPNKSSSKSSSSVKSSSLPRTSSSSSKASSSRANNTNPDPTGPITGNFGTHDPSRIIESNGKYFFYSTGRGVPMKYSTDKLRWTAGPSVFPNGFPAWTRQAVPGNDGYDAWAPDIFYMNGQYHLYYSVSKWGGDRSAIGLVTTPSLDPTASNYKWTDRGAVITDGPSDSYSAIDPAPFFDKDGNPWLVWGSGYTVSWSTPTVMLIQLDKNTGKRISNNSTIYSLAPGHVEAAYIHYRNGYYYLFYNDGGCCSGTSSTYKIHMLRSTSVTGPYLDKSGVKNGSNNLFMQSSSGLHGPGHIGIFSKNGHDYFNYHYYNSSGSPVLGLGRLIWGSNGWPTPGK